MQRLRRIHHDERQIRIRHCLITAFDSEQLDAVLALTNAGRIDKTDRNTVQRSRFRNRVASSPGNVRHDRSILLDETIEQAALADIRTPDDRQRKTAVHEFSVSKASRKFVNALLNNGEPA